MPTFGCGVRTSWHGATIETGAPGARCADRPALDRVQDPLARGCDSPVVIDRHQSRSQSIACSANRRTEPPVGCPREILRRRDQSLIAYTFASRTCSSQLKNRMMLMRHAIRSSSAFKFRELLFLAHPLCSCEAICAGRALCDLSPALETVLIRGQI